MLHVKWARKFQIFQKYLAMKTLFGLLSTVRFDLRLEKNLWVDGLHFNNLIYWLKRALSYPIL